MNLAVAILLFVTTQRLGELWLSNRNTRRLLVEGAHELGSSHYPLIVTVHALWLGALWWFAPARPVNLPLLAVFALLQIARLWVIAALGRRWTTRIIILPNAPLVERGPYRLLAHPNYAVVMLEIAILPLAFGLIGVAAIFTLLNAAVLTIRITAENRALPR